MKIGTKIILLVVCGIFVSGVSISLLSVWQIKKTAEFNIKTIESLGRANIDKIREQSEKDIAKFKEEVIKNKKGYLKSQMQIAIASLKKVLQDAKESFGSDQNFTDEVKKAIQLELQEKIAKFIGSLRYGPENKDYFWINDMRPVMIIDPYKPQLNGKDLSNIKDPNGKRLFVEFVRVCKEKGEGFVDYMWPKYGSKRPVPKLSFVKLFKDWNWIIGTGIYLDDIENIISKKRANMDKEMKILAQDIENQISDIKADTKKRIRDTLVKISLITILIIMLSLLPTVFITKKSITNPINNIIKELREGSEHVSSAATQINSSSQMLAEGASEQAASIEETSSSLEEMASMTKQNADNATEADNLMKEVNQVVEDANRSMGELKGSMTEISKSSEKTSKIIKTIDEIAFQTNLLALNAAVEAARAGEAGAGFAVVADEVRNLAMRAADAARNTAELIEGTVKRIKEGTDLVARTDEAFGRVSESALKVGELVSEISAASREQAQGIEQINRAVSEMDKVVQQTASSAEQSASAAQELNAQAEELKKIVNELVNLTGVQDQNQELKIKEVEKIEIEPNIIKKEKSPETKHIISLKDHDKEIRPEKVIPLDDDFQDF